MDNGDPSEYEAMSGGLSLDGGVEDYDSPPKPDSPRTVWFRENREMLVKKEEAEKQSKEALMLAAREYIADFYTERRGRIEKTKKLNREDEAKAKELKQCPRGSVWEQILDMIDFNQGVQQKDVSRARSLLFQAKEADLPEEA